MAVDTIRPQIGRDRDGNPDASSPQDTIEVHAYFTSEDGFFGLTSYLGYAHQQLQKTYNWIEFAQKQDGVLHSFPWRRLNDDGIEAEGFIRDTFQFEINQAKILDLLTGHTLMD